MHITKVTHLGKIYEVITDDPIDKPIFLMRPSSGRLTPLVKLEYTKVPLGKYLFGFNASIIGENDLDYRRENVKPFNMAEYNLKRRSYPKNNTGERGIYKLKNGKFRVAIYRNKQKIFIDKPFDLIEDAVNARKNILAEM